MKLLNLSVFFTVLYMGWTLESQSGSIPFSVRSMSIPDFLVEGQMFVDPEMASGNWFGGGVQTGDWNRDGQTDIFISSFLADPDGITNAGAVYVFLGPEFENYERILAPEPEEGDNFGMQIEFEDMNGDQVNDLVVSCLRSRYVQEDGTVLDQAGSVRLIWGPGYKEELRFFDEFPEANGFVGRGLEVADCNQDGNLDIIYGSTGADGKLGKTIIVYGPDFETRHDLYSPDLGDIRFGVNMAAGDWDHDGFIDLIIGADYAYSLSGLANAGYLQIWHGPEFNEEDVEFFEDPVPQENVNFGTSVAFGDINADGIDDLIVGKSNTKSRMVKNGLVKL